MSFSNGPTVVTNGLVLSLDAGDRNSYVSGSITWFDLAGSSNPTLYNGPTFNTGSFGSIVFDGVDDYAQTTGPQYTDQVSFVCWFKTSSNQGNRYLMGMAKTLGGNNGFDLVLDPDSIGSYIVTTNGLTNPRYTVNYYNNVWHMTVTTYNGTNARFYYDGVLQSTTSITGNVDIESTRLLGIGAWANGAAQANASIAVAQFYNRALSASEVQQNYNALKGRFGL
jgi:hypothetical protein